MSGFWTPLDSAAIAAAGPLALYILLSGIDDLFIDLVWMFTTIRSWTKPLVTREQIDQLPQKRAAIFVPAWHEHEVIGKMLEHNAASIHYEAYDFFVGVYPNDHRTIQAVREAERRLPNVHLAMAPHPGPTSKGDCLNWIYQSMLLHEEMLGGRYELILMHDSEDIIHPDSLRLVNFHADRYGFIQIPVLALQTPLANLTHGIYCDEFAETQTRDLPARCAMGAFVPSAGVGTAFTREAIDTLAEASNNRVFEPDSLTEDYETGLRLHELHCKQLFLPIQIWDGGFAATREYFPCHWKTAIRQRTRWITGISLQTWQRHGWRGNLLQKYWFWRDRKGLIGNPLSIAAFVLFLYGLATNLQPPPASLIGRLYPYTLALLLFRVFFRTACCARVYGPWLAFLTPVRAIHANWINASATMNALWRYAKSRRNHERLAWLKTEHQYPNREALVSQRRRLGDLLVQSRAISRQDLDLAVATQPPGLRLGEHLVNLGLTNDESVYEALSLQQFLPLAWVDQASPKVGRCLPAQIIRDRKMLPFRLEEKSLAVCCPEPPDDEARRVLSAFTRLQIRFYLMTPARYRRLEEQVLGSIAA